MVKLTEKDPIYFEVFDALTYFVGRQQMVLRFLTELGIRPEDMKGVAGWHGKSSQKGMWGTDWHFFFHGGGCQLTHTKTGEPINWEGPDPAAFSTPSFIQHIEWRLAHQTGLPVLRDYVEKHGLLTIIELIDDLIADHIISPERHLASTSTLSARDAA